MSVFTQGFSFSKTRSTGILFRKLGGLQSAVGRVCEIDEFCYLSARYLSDAMYTGQ